MTDDECSIFGPRTTRSKDTIETPQEGNAVRDGDRVRPRERRIGESIASARSLPAIGDLHEIGYRLGEEPPC